jgi:hypothetical protein
MATKGILDVDTGTDDAVALMIAALSPDLGRAGPRTCASRWMRTSRRSSGWPMDMLGRIA